MLLMGTGPVSAAVLCEAAGQGKTRQVSAATSYNSLVWHREEVFIPSDGLQLFQM